MARILVIDDEPSRLDLLDTVLRRKGHEVVTAQPLAEMSNIVPSRISVVLILERKTRSSTGILGCSQHSIRVACGMH